MKLLKTLRGFLIVFGAVAGITQALAGNTYLAYAIILILLFVLDELQDEKRDSLQREVIELHYSHVLLLQQTITNLAEIHLPKREHVCPEMDGLVINEFDPEFNYCTCFKE